MKAHLLLSSLLLAAGFGPCALAVDESPNSSPLAVARTAFVEIGMKRELVREMLGMPAAQLAPDIWVYFDFRPVSLSRPAKGDTLIVSFIQDRVRYLTLVDGQHVRALIARQQQKSKPPATVVASK